MTYVDVLFCFKEDNVGCLMVEVHVRSFLELLQ